MQIGSQITVPLFLGGERHRDMVGTVIYIHPQRRFVTVEVDLSGPGRFYGERWTRRIRESFLLQPPPERRCSALDYPLAGPERGHEPPVEDSRRLAEGALIRRERVRQGLTAGEVADRIGVTKASVCRWELGRRAADWALLETVFPGISDRRDKIKLPKEECVNG